MENLLKFEVIKPIYSHPSLDHIWIYRVGNLIIGSATLLKDTEFTYEQTLLELPVISSFHSDFQTGLNGLVFGLRKDSSYLKHWQPMKITAKQYNVYNFIFVADY